MSTKSGLIPSRRKLITDITVTSNQWQTNPKQQRFLYNYFTHDRTKTFGNVYQSAIDAGYSESYARTLTRSKNKNLWINDYLSKQEFTPEHITQGITNLAINSLRDADKLKALELLAKLKGLLVDKSIVGHVNIEQAINDLK